MVERYRRKLYIIFERRPKVTPWRWWHVFTGEWAHCYVCVETMGGIMRLSSSYSGLTLHEVPGDIFDFVEWNADNIIDILMYESDCDTTFSRKRGLITCVSMAKALMCAPVPWWVVTPKQLHRWIMGSVLSKPKAPDTSKQEKLLKEQKAETRAANEAALAEENRRLEAMRRKRAGQRSLLSGGQYETLG